MDRLGRERRRIDGLLERERAGPRSEPGLDKPAATESIADVAGDRSDVGPAAAIDFELEMRPGVIDHGDPVDPDQSRRQLDGLAGPGQVVGSRPSIFRAEYSGGRLDRPCPRGERIACWISPADGICGDASTSIRPSASSVSLRAPRRTTVRYDLGKSCRFSTSRVAGPTQTIRIPVASGSSVPACPTLERGSKRATWSTSLRDVMPVAC